MRRIFFEKPFMWFEWCISEPTKSIIPFFNNCSDFTRDTLNKGDISTERDTIPNDYYENVKSSGKYSSENKIEN